MRSIKSYGKTNAAFSKRHGRQTVPIKIATLACGQQRIGSIRTILAPMAVDCGNGLHLRQVAKRTEDPRRQRRSVVAI